MERFSHVPTRSAPHELEPALATATALVRGLRQLPDGRELALPARGRVIVGSGPQCDLTVRDPFVSAQHCAIERSANGVRVRDLSSKNGTLLNGSRVFEAELRVGSLLTLGGTRWLAIGASSAGVRPAIEQLVGADPCFRAAVELAVRAGRSDCSVLILGETGTGKELFARAVHENSRRSRGSFFAVNCGAIATELIGSELFGHVRGAFTGALQDRAGWFEQASGGTLFLDEIGELPLPQQPHLLRVLESRRVRRIGDAVERPVDVRIVAATNRPATSAGGCAALRDDLYRRLATVLVHLPPLRERRGDARRLVEHFLAELAPTYGARVVSASTWRAINTYHWPGNVRELRQATLRALATGPARLDFDHFVPGAARAPLSRAGFVAPPVGEAPRQSSGGRCDDVVRDLIVDALELHGSYRRAARALGMSKSTLADRVRRYGIQWPPPGRYGRPR